MLTNVHSGQPILSRRADVRAGWPAPIHIVLVGGGPASASVLMRLAQHLRAGPATPHPVVEITLVDRDGETGGGAPHGVRTPPGLLLNDKLDDIDASRMGLTEWLHANRSRWIGGLLDTGDPSAARWLRRNRDALARTDFGGIFLPRRVFGDFIRQRFAEACRDLAARGVCVRVVEGDATSVRPSGRDGWHVTFTNAPTGLRADAVLLAVGSLSPAPPADVAEHPGYIRYAGARNVTAIQRRLAGVLAARPVEGGRVVVVLGSSAAASEVLYCLDGSVELTALAPRIVVVSASGRLPDGLPSGLIRPFECRHLPRLLASAAITSAGLTSAALVEALRRDVAQGRQLGYTIVDILPSLGPLFSSVLSQLTPREKRRFVERDGLVYRALVRHTPPDYAAAADRLASAGRMSVIQGRVTALAPSTSAGIDVRHLRGGQTSTIDAAAVFDCRGFTGVREAANPVVTDLLGGKIVHANTSGRGLRVTDSFEAAPALFVLGPALAGTSNSTAHIWSLENIARIHGLADHVAAALCARLAARAAVTAGPATVP